MNDYIKQKIIRYTVEVVQTLGEEKLRCVMAEDCKLRSNHVKCVEIEYLYRTGMTDSVTEQFIIATEDDSDSWNEILENIETNLDDNGSMSGVEELPQL